MKQKTYQVAPELTAEERANLNKFSDITAKILFRRKIKTNDEAEAFMNADYEKHTRDPFLLKDMEKVVERILRAIKNDEKVCVYSDYDADGVPGAVVLSDFFKKIGFKNFFVYIPHRNLEGFGLNDEAIQKIFEQDAKLIITIDCGIADISQVDLANLKKIEVIITDHHECGAILPAAYAIINPKQPGCNYPEKYLCGSGVIFKVVQALIARGNFGLVQGWEKWLLDMVGLATLSDMVPLTGENRVFAKFGLQVLRKSPRLGLMKLLKDNGLKQRDLTEDDVVFTITPRINAASRMGSPETAFQMLSTDDEATADDAVRHLHKINDERKGVVAAMVREIKKYVNGNLLEDGKLRVPVIVKGNPDWSPSLLGLAASSIVEAYGCPVFLWGRGEGDELKGSCRSDGSASVVDLMTALPAGILEAFGGHMMAGGFVLSMAGVDDLESALVEAYKNNMNSAVDSFQKIVDMTASVNDVSWRLHDELDKMAPFGIGNEKPVFMFHNAEVSDIFRFGKEKNHIKLIFKKSDGGEVSAIQFFVAESPKFANLKFGDKINLVACLEKSTFGGKRELRLRVVDLF